MRPDHTSPAAPQKPMVQTRSRTSPIVEQTPLFPNDGHASARGWGHKLKTSEYVDVFKAVDPLRAMLQRVRQTAAYARPPSAAPVGVEALAPPGLRVAKNNNIRVAVIGCGIAGLGITGELLRRGCTVMMYDANEATREDALGALSNAIEEHIDSGLLLPKDLDGLMSHASVASSIQEAMENAVLVVEAVKEDAEIKQCVFAEIVDAGKRLNRHPDSYLLASNTLSISLATLSASMPEEWSARVIGLRFLYPCWFIDECEVTMGPKWCTYTGGEMVHVNRRQGSGTQLAYNEAEQLLTRQLRFRPLRYIGAERRAITPSDMEHYRTRQERLCARDIAAEGGAPAARPAMAIS